MNNIIEIISRVTSGAIPILWFFSMFMYIKKDKFENMCAVLTLLLMFFGLIECILTAIGF